MPIPNSITDISTDPTLNYPLGTDQIGSSLDNYLRAYQAILKQQFVRGADLTCGATLTIPSIGSYFVVNGTGTVQVISNCFSGKMLVLRFGAGVVIQNNSGIILPGGANITTLANDCLIFINESDNVWRCIDYMRSDGNSVVPCLPLSGGTLTGPLTLAANGVNPLNAATVQQLNTAVSTASIIGSIIWFAGIGTPPLGTTWCNGQAISRTGYSKLFAAIGTRYGAGDGSTTFNIPNIQFTDSIIATIRGNEANLGQRFAGTVQSHTHTGTVGASGSLTMNVSSPSGDGMLLSAARGDKRFVDADNNNALMNLSNLTASGGDHTHSVTINSNNPGATNNIPTGIFMMPLIVCGIYGS